MRDFRGLFRVTPILNKAAQEIGPTETFPLADLADVSETEPFDLEPLDLELGAERLMDERQVRRGSSVRSDKTKARALIRSAL